MIPILPPIVELETKAVLRKVASAHRYLAELKGVSESIPNQSILLNTLPLQEAKDSSAIENIITTHDELFKESLFPELVSSGAAKEVGNYVSALRIGYDEVQKNGLLTSRQIEKIQEELEKNRAGFRKLPGTELRNEQTGETIYVPPQSHAEIVELMSNLERFINDDGMFDVDHLIKMAVIHYQFESIHPFYDGNGRTGRIINILYLVQKGLLGIPVLYLSRYIVQNKTMYYRLLQRVRDTQDWESWLLYMLDGVEQTARETIVVIQRIKKLMHDYKHRIRDQYPRFYSQDLINNLFSHPYTKIAFIERDLKVSRLTATSYLDQLVQGGFLHKERVGRSNYFINRPLFEIMQNPPRVDTAEDLAPLFIKTVNPEGSRT